MYVLAASCTEECALSSRGAEEDLGEELKEEPRERPGRSLGRDLGKSLGRSPGRKLERTLGVTNLSFLGILRVSALE